MNPGMHALAGVITEKFITSAPKEAAAALAGLATHEVILLIGGLKAQHIIMVLNLMDASKAAAVLRRLPQKQASYVLTHLDVPQAARLWKEFSTPYQERLRAGLPAAFVELLQEAGTYAPDSVGRWMETDVVSVRTETKIAELISRLKNLPRPKLPYICLVTDKNNVLKGAIRSAELAFFNSAAVCGSVMTKIPSVTAADTLSAAQGVFSQAQADVLAVVNADGVLLGTLDKTAVLGALVAPKKTLWEKLKG